MVVCGTRPVQPSSPVQRRIQENIASRLHEQIGVLGWEVRRDPVVALGGNARDEQLAIGVADGSGGFVSLVEVLPPGRDSLAEHQRLSSLRTLPALRDLAVINSSRMLVESWVRGVGGRWKLVMADDPERNLHFSALGVNIPLREIYHRVRLGSTPFPGGS